MKKKKLKAKNSIKAPLDAKKKTTKAETFCLVKVEELSDNTHETELSRDEGDESVGNFQSSPKSTARAEFKFRLLTQLRFPADRDSHKYDVTADVPRVPGDLR